MSKDDQHGGTRRHRPALIVLVAVAAVVCLGMAWWQWDRFESSSGTGQNLGYALQWPMFAIAFIYAYRRFVVMESDPEDTVRKQNRHGDVTEIPEHLLPQRATATASAMPSLESDDPEEARLASYNEALKELAAEDAAASSTTPGAKTTPRSTR
ncbi:hypothetical protein [Jongsikchunia kroppenstedtii]|uniref:hypothetical protein n=1 Tax=Jongsikchunia kroppenstedtii TaxID=1121721 RepID=UPI0003808D5F|nr:hypothetical protein [Jongsikchunia kroppenstedtii]